MANSVVSSNQWGVGGTITESLSFLLGEITASLLTAHYAEQISRHKKNFCDQISILNCSYPPERQANGDEKLKIAYGIQAGLLQQLGTARHHSALFIASKGPWKSQFMTRAPWEVSSQTWRCRSSMQDHQSGWMFTLRINKTQTCDGRQRSKVLQGNRERLYYSSISVVFALGDPSLTSNLVYGGRKYPLTNSLFSECPFSHITPAECPLTNRPEETNSFSFTEENNEPLPLLVRLN